MVKIKPILFVVDTIFEYSQSVVDDICSMLPRIQITNLKKSLNIDYDDTSQTSKQKDVVVNNWCVYEYLYNIFVNKEFSEIVETSNVQKIYTIFSIGVTFKNFENYIEYCKVNEKNVKLKTKTEFLDFNGKLKALLQNTSNYSTILYVDENFEIDYYNLMFVLRSILKAKR
jgi:hypothetical protein